MSQAIEAPVRQVTFFEDRAQVVRQARVSLPAGPHRLLIEQVSPLVADHSLTANVPDTARLDEIKVIRRWRIGSAEKPEGAADLDVEIERLENAVQHQQEMIEAVDSQRALLGRAGQLYVDNLNREMPFAETVPARWENGAEKLLEAAAGLGRQWFELRTRLQELVEEQDGVELRRDLGERPDQQLQCSLQLDLELSQAADLSLEVAYQVPCALWRPIHRARLQGDRLVFACEAAAWQNTGEDWSDVQCRFSTARSTALAEPPVLRDDRLRAQRKQERKVEVAYTEQAIADTGEGLARRTDALPGVDDGGEVRTLSAAERTNLTSDGRMRRIGLFEFECEARLDRICCPELDPLVHKRTVQVNQAPSPLLAGPVDLVRDGGLVGRGRIDFVAQNERFALAWGSEDALRVRREIDESRETARLGGKQTVTHDVRLYLSNLDDRPVAFTLQERIPVSEIEKVQVRIDDKHTTKPDSVDDDGRVSWKVALQPHEPREIVLQYAVVASGDVKGV